MFGRRRGVGAVDGFGLALWSVCVRFVTRVLEFGYLCSYRAISFCAVGFQGIKVVRDGAECMRWKASVLYH